jgi:hypothetical protein
MLMLQIHVPAVFIKTSGNISWSRVLLAFGLIFGPLILVLSTAAQPTPRNVTLLFSILSGGLYALAFYLTRKWWLPLLAAHPVRNACLMGIFNAAMIETIFWAIERLVGASGVAASSNLALDLLITMPWYIGMVVIFVWAQDRRHFPLAVVLLLGAVYETGADGFIGGMIFGGGLFSPGAWVLLALAFWEFIPVYASMVMPPALVVDQNTREPAPAYPAWRDALSPLLWLIPFAIYLAIVLVSIALLSKT